MKTLTIKTYTYEELPRHIQEKILTEKHDNLLREPYPWHYDNEQSLYKFADLFDLTIYSYEYGGYGNDHVAFEFNDPEIEEITDTMSFSRFYRFIINNYWKILYKPKKTYYHRNNNNSLTKNCVSTNSVIYTSKIYYQISHFTGYHLDYSLLQPLIDFLEEPYSTTLKDLFQNCVNNWIQDASLDIEDYYSKEFLYECLLDNDTFYTEDGAEITIQ